MLRVISKSGKAYVIGDELDRGEQGRFCEASCGNDLLGVKILNADPSAFEGGICKEFQINKDLNESDIVDQSCVMQVFDWAENNNEIYIFVERIHNFTKLPELNEPVLKKSIKSLISVVKAFHEHGIAHCDLSTDNVLFQATGEFKIIDFGKAVRLADDQSAASKDLNDLKTLISLLVNRAGLQSKNEFYGHLMDENGFQSLDEVAEHFWLQS